VNPTTFTQFLRQELNKLTTNARTDALTPLTPYSPLIRSTIDPSLLSHHFLTPFHHLLSDSLSRLRQTTAAVLALLFTPTCVTVQETISPSDSPRPQYITEVWELLVLDLHQHFHYKCPIPSLQKEFILLLSSSSCASGYWFY